MSHDHVATVQRIYAAFGRGDLPAILAEVSDDTEWGFNVAASEVPWHAAVRGREELPSFFGALAENLDFQVFEPLAFLPSADQVIVHLRLAYAVRRTGRRVEEEQLQWWSFDPTGRVRRLRHFEDTAQVLAAWKG
jgi:ketosteroid isomerase-like protein